ncbi:hypothetical protein D3C73_1433090 [compost metagenome]
MSFGQANSDFLSSDGAEMLAEFLQDYFREQMEESIDEGCAYRTVGGLRAVGLPGRKRSGFHRYLVIRTSVCAG